MIEVETTHIEGLLVITPRVFHDDRGYFFESYNAGLYKEAGIDFDFVQDNESCSSKGVLRGLHFQAPPYEQGKLVRVVTGAVLDVAVDIRRASPTFGQSYSIHLTAENKKMLWIPPGFAHGFVTLEDDTRFLYKCTHFYNKASEGSIRWNDPELGINWEVEAPVVSAKDSQALFLSEQVSPF